jgi:hypothetical protein
MIEIVLVRVDNLGNWEAIATNLKPRRSFVDTNPRRALKKLAKILEEEDLFDG